jgi:DnaK suppressor protein
MQNYIWRIMATKIILEPGYKPSEDEEYMCDKHLEYFKQKLLAQKENLLQESCETIKHLKEENRREPDATDRATTETDTSRELRVSDRKRKLIDKIDVTLENIQDAMSGKNKMAYGYCTETDEEIGLKRLEARPVATLSLEAQERREKFEKQHSDDDEAE